MSECRAILTETVVTSGGVSFKLSGTKGPGRGSCKLSGLFRICSVSELPRDICGTCSIDDPDRDAAAWSNGIVNNFKTEECDDFNVTSTEYVHVTLLNGQSTELEDMIDCGDDRSLSLPSKHVYKRNYLATAVSLGPANWGEGTDRPYGAYWLNLSASNRAQTYDLDPFIFEQDLSVPFFQAAGVNLTAIKDISDAKNPSIDNTLANEMHQYCEVNTTICKPYITYIQGNGTSAIAEVGWVKAASPITEHFCSEEQRSRNRKDLKMYSACEAMQGGESSRPEHTEYGHQIEDHLASNSYLPGFSFDEEFMRFGEPCTGQEIAAFLERESRVGVDEEVFSICLGDERCVSLASDGYEGEVSRSSVAVWDGYWLDRCPVDSYPTFGVQNNAVFIEYDPVDGEGRDASDSVRIYQHDAFGNKHVVHELNFADDNANCTMFDAPRNLDCLSAGRPEALNSLVRLDDDTNFCVHYSKNESASDQFALYAPIKMDSAVSNPATVPFSCAFADGTDAGLLNDGIPGWAIFLIVAAILVPLIIAVLFLWFKKRKAQGALAANTSGTEGYKQDEGGDYYYEYYGADTTSGPQYEYGYDYEYEYDYVTDAAGLTSRSKRAGLSSTTKTSPSNTTTTATGVDSTTMQYTEPTDFSNWWQKNHKSRVDTSNTAPTHRSRKSNRKRSERSSRR